MPSFRGDRSGCIRRRYPAARQSFRIHPAPLSKDTPGRAPSPTARITRHSSASKAPTGADASPALSGRAEWNPSWRPPENREWARDAQFTPPGPNNPMGRVKLFFAPLYYIHGTPDSASIGQPASHGCVRMRNRDVIALARLLHEHARPTVGSAEIDAILRRSGTTRWSTFRAPVPLVIRYEPVVIEGGSLTVYPDVYDRSRIHTESVIQALLAAGYDAGSVDRAQIRAVLQRARQTEGTFTVRVEDAFRGLERRADATAN
ncbi:MAG TPA: L,D-transpeptidase [Longimicrobium sp.]|nr:L,D-transpeptidase [Longimicrobium sp.]